MSLFYDSFELSRQDSESINEQHDGLAKEFEQRQNDPEYLRQVIQELKERYGQLQLEYKEKLEILRAIKKIEQQLIDQSLGKGKAFDIEQQAQVIYQQVAKKNAAVESVLANAQVLIDEQQAKNNTKQAERSFPVAAVAVLAAMVAGFMWLAK